MMKTAAAMGLVLSAAIAAPSWAADEGAVYLWVDKDGTPHYQDRPPEGELDARELNLRYRLTDGQAVAAAGARQDETEEVANLREQQQGEDAANEEADRERVLGEREQGCAKARERLAKYDSAHRLYKPGPDGARNYLTDEEIDAARLEARRTVDEWCGEE